ncbi:MAG TPA: AraC family transcriptional regulator [Acidobacteriota bacterium]|nr:AraC family transcriptional regulator [Acidobacteriota bacterium]
MQLDPGCYCGRIVGSRQGEGFLLTETVYPARTRLSAHSHKHAYLCLIRQGHYREHYGRRLRECRPDMLAFHPSGEEHREEFGPDPVRSFNIELQDDFAGKGLDRHLEQAAESCGGRATWAAHQLYREFRRWDSSSHLAAEGLIIFMLVELGRRRSERPERRLPGWLKQAREILESRLGERVKLGEVARQVDVHPVYLCDQFRRFYRSTPGEFLRRRRVERAGRQLRESGRPLAQIALENGFSDQSHFTRVFREQTGLTPGDYRRRNRQGH